MSQTTLLNSEVDLMCRQYNAQMIFLSHKLAQTSGQCPQAKHQVMTLRTEVEVLSSELHSGYRALTTLQSNHLALQVPTTPYGHISNTHHPSDDSGIT
eukprot:5200613-Amphidinium_carterae.1